MFNNLHKDVVLMREMIGMAEAAMVGQNLTLDQEISSRMFCCVFMLRTKIFSVKVLDWFRVVFRGSCLGDFLILFAAPMQTCLGDNVPPNPSLSFEATGFPSRDSREVQNAGFFFPNSNSGTVLAVALQSRDIVAIAKTGSGKTLGYLLPGFIHLKRSRNDPQMGPTVLVLSPTRELATQIQDEAVKFGKSSRISCVCLYGGAPKGPQLRDIDRGADVVVATPGRLNDILEMKRISLHQQLGQRRFRRLQADLLVNPVQVNIGNVDELKMCDQLSRNLTRQFGAAAIHGDKSQSERDYVLNQFRSGRTPILVATDVAARGLDIKDIRVVINYDFPTGVEDYVHRIGRTGRAGATGLAYTFFGDQDSKFRRWGSGSGGRDGGRGGRNDSSYGGRDGGRGGGWGFTPSSGRYDRGHNNGYR
ncbi:hypothetical protein GBA52_011901 [Prunus armeniaca]|nr:hypothetical protein GBA52_011901 [Prunus armeniaca]